MDKLMLDQNKLQKQLAYWSGGALLLAAATLLGMIIYTSSSFSGNSIIGTKLVSMGPIKLVELGRENLNGQTAAVITYLPGLIWYFTISAGIGALIALFQSRK